LLPFGADGSGVRHELGARDEFRDDALTCRVHEARAEESGKERTEEPLNRLE